jgi:hypothetical protein
MNGTNSIIGVIAMINCMHMMVQFLPHLFDKVVVDSSSVEYAEQLPSWWPWYLSPNLLVNIGYLIVGQYWHRYSMTTYGRLQPYCHNIIVTFAALALAYGPIQGLRVITQTRTWSIMDQWITLPFFGWAIYSCIILRWYPNHFRGYLSIIVMLISLSSYCLAIWLPPHGFEIALGLHMIPVLILVVYLSATPVPSKSKPLPGPLVVSKRSRLVDLLLGLICCLSFVVLKLADHWLANIHPVFHIISGHFLSKIGDFGQIHFLLCILTHEMVPVIKP